MFRCSYLLLIVITLLAGCVTTPPQLKMEKLVAASTASPSGAFKDERFAQAKVARVSNEKFEQASWLADEAFSPELPRLIGGLLAERFDGSLMKTVALTQADVGLTNLSGVATSGYRGVPYIPPGTHPGAAALGILLGEGLIYLASSVRAGNSSGNATGEHWTVYLSVSFDGVILNSFNRRKREANDDGAAVLATLLKTSADEILSQHRVRFPELYRTTTDQK